MTFSTLNKLTAAAFFLTTAVLMVSSSANSVSNHRGTGRINTAEAMAFRASGRLHNAIAFRASGRLNTIATYRGSEHDMNTVG